jgi:hypothetical protein
MAQRTFCTRLVVHHIEDRFRIMVASQLHLDPSLYGTAATVIPVFWLGLLYQVNAY